MVNLLLVPLRTIYPISTVFNFQLIIGNSSPDLPPVHVPGRPAGLLLPRGHALQPAGAGVRPRAERGVRRGRRVLPQERRPPPGVAQGHRQGQAE